MSDKVPVPAITKVAVHPPVVIETADTGSAVNPANTDIDEASKTPAIRGRILAIFDTYLFRLDYLFQVTRDVP
jgi:hypothetical protein